MLTRLAPLIALIAVSSAAAQVPRADLAQIEACRRAVIGCQLTNGAVALVGYKRVNQPARIDPYFANLACLGVLAAHELTPDRANLAFVRAWLEWYADNQRPDGTINCFNGKRTAAGGLQPRPTQEAPDSHDSYAATYLLVAARYQKAAKARPPEKAVTACRKCLAVVKRCQGANGLYWNFPPTSVPGGKAPAQYLLDNVEVQQGLAAGAEFFAAAGDRKTASECAALSKALAARMADFWYPEEQYYVCMFGDKAARVPFGKQPLAAEGLATASALAFLSMPPARRAALWKKLLGRHLPGMKIGFATGNFAAEDPTIERVYLAASRAGTAKDRAVFLGWLRARAAELLRRNADLASPAKAGLSYPYVHRYGLTIVALAGQSGRPATQLPAVP